jgi:hypothetical protein
VANHRPAARAGRREALIAVEAQARAVARRPERGDPRVRIALDACRCPIARSLTLALINPQASVLHPVELAHGRIRVGDERFERSLGQARLLCEQHRQQAQQRVEVDALAL